MDYGKIVGDSFEYAKEGLVGDWKKWFLLLVSCIIFPLILGYMLRIYRGATPSPEPDEWGTMFIDGLKLLVVGIIYALPIIILELVLMGAGFVMYMQKTPFPNPASMMELFGAALAGVILLLVLAVIIGLFSAIGYVRFARTGSIGEAFNFGAITEQIGRIGWITYIVALIIVAILVGIVEFICLLIPYVGLILLILLLPFIILFTARYITLVYDSAGTV